jgi:16S rRNA (cytosine1402-N4)-methyltransferase
MLYALIHDLFFKLMAIHLPVLECELLSFFKPENGQHFLDCTFGGGGHTRAFLEAGTHIRVSSIDCDPEAKKRTEKLNRDFGNRFKFFPCNFSALDEVEEKEFDGIFFDLGVSSFQLECAERGFSFQYKGKPDMRFNDSEGISAAEFLERVPKEKLIQAIRDYGEENCWRQVVENILTARGTGLLQDTKNLTELIEKAIRIKRKRSERNFRIHPATKSFQGIRIAVNRELECLEQALPKAMDKLKTGGLLGVISFHSLEDRVVKRCFRRMAGLPEHRGDSLPKDLRKSQAVLLTNKPVRSSTKEIMINPRSRSAKLRVLRKLCNGEI